MQKHAGLPFNKHVGQEAPNLMNGERNNYWLNGGVALALGLIMSSIVLGWFYTHARKGDEAITGYSLAQSIEVRSNDVDKIAQIAREATELINQGILIESNAPQYFYTKIGDLKIEMLGEAAKDAKTRAEQIAASTGNSIGAVRSAKMGVLQVTAADSTEVSDGGI